MSMRWLVGSSIVFCLVGSAHAQGPAPADAAPATTQAQPVTPVVSDSTAAPPPSGTEPSATPSASDAEAARAHFKMGVDFYRERNFRAALIEFQRAYRASPHYKLLYNLGQAEVELQEYAPAIDYLSGYLRAARDEIDDARRKEVEQTILELQARIATVTVECEQGASIFVDDMLIGHAPLDHLIRVGAGRRRFAAERDNGQRAERVLDVAAGDHLTVPLRFEDKSETLAAAESAAAPTSSASSWSATPWAIAATAVLAAAAGTTAVLTALAQKDYKDERRRETTRTSLETLRDDAKTKALVTDILLSATVASAIVTTVLILTESGEPVDSSERAAAGSMTPSTQPSLRIAVGLGAVSVGGTL